MGGFLEQNVIQKGSGGLAAEALPDSPIAWLAGRGRTRRGGQETTTDPPKLIPAGADQDQPESSLQ